MVKPALVSNYFGVQEVEPIKRLRFVTATSLFDGHDATINIIRRILQSHGGEVIHLGHNRSVSEIVSAAIQEDVDGIAVSSYQGGHIEYYQYLIDQLRARNNDSILVFGGGGGVIQADEIDYLQKYGVARIYSPHDGQKIGIAGMVEEMMGLCLEQRKKRVKTDNNLDFRLQGSASLARILSLIEHGKLTPRQRRQIVSKANSLRSTVAILGVTGPGGSGKSSLCDELIGRFREYYSDQLKIGVIAVDPSRQKTAGALLGDRIRMNAIDSDRIFVRSMATHEAQTEIPENLPDCIDAMISFGFDLILVETPGIGQGNTGIVEFVDVVLYVMTSEFGAASQLEKISILDYADIVAINKFDRHGSEDALRDVQKQMQRNHEEFDVPCAEFPVFGTIASRMNDAGVSALYQRLLCELAKDEFPLPTREKGFTTKAASNNHPIIPDQRSRYLQEIAETVRMYHRLIDVQCRHIRELNQFCNTQEKLPVEHKACLDDLIAERKQKLDPRCTQLLDDWPSKVNLYKAEVVRLSDHEMATLSYTKSRSGLNIPKVCLPNFTEPGDLLKWLMLENLPGEFPYTAGVFLFKRSDEEPTRMFAGEGDPSRTNLRFKYLTSHSQVNRLSTAFDSVTLYGFDPDERPDIYGKIGNSGVSVATLDDMKALFEGFNLCDPRTSVSMTINGPAPAILAMFFNTAIDQQVARFTSENSRSPQPDEYANIKSRTLACVRGTLQADILKEDQGQNTCIFSIGFSLRLMGDIQEYFAAQKIAHFYSVSVSGYHIAEAGANPITQLAFTLANGFTYVEAFLARGLDIDDFGHRLSFFFSNGMDPEYTVIGRVARRIWAIALRERYGAGARSQKLKYHVQTSGRSLHAQTLDYNEIRTTLQALIALYDNCNSLHTNAKDEAQTTPTEDTVRRALAIQMIIDKEWGLAKNENTNQGSFIIEYLTDLVERAVLTEFEKLSERGGVLGAMETGYQRSRIQQESMVYEAGKQDGSVPIVGVNVAHTETRQNEPNVKFAKSTEIERNNQIERLRRFKQQHKKRAVGALNRLKKAALGDENLFCELMETVRVCSLKQITDALFEVGGKYRRNM